MGKKVITVCVLSLYLVISQSSSVFGFTDVGDGYFPLFLPTQDQIQQEKEYTNSYEGNSLLQQIYQEKETKKELIPLVLPTYIVFQEPLQAVEPVALPLYLPKTGAIAL